MPAPDKASLSAEIQIRPALPTDLPFILAMVPRLAAFGPPPWRSPEQMTRIDCEVLTRAVEQPTTGHGVFIAETDQPAGFLHLNTHTDYYQQTHAHIADVVVAASAEGQGVGRALLAYAETWALAQGFASLSLSVFSQNEHARRLYQQAGFGEDIISYVKPLRRPGPR